MDHSSICSVHDGSQDGQLVPGGLARQGSRAQLKKQQSRGQMKRQQSASRMVVERDTYESGKGKWQNSLRGTSKANEGEGRNERKTSRSHSIKRNETENGSRKLLEPHGHRRFVWFEKLLIL